MPFSWDVLANPPGFATSTMLLLTDGRVICQKDGSPDWSALTPDSHGSYKNGAWTPIAPMAIWRRYYASAVLANGKVFVAGGENAPTGDTNECEIYDPVADSWTAISPPAGWTSIGDAPCAVLDDGRVLIGDINTTRTVIYDPVAGAWTGTGTKGDRSSEETWTLLRDGSVLTVQCNPVYPKASERYVPSLGAWVDAGSTQADLVAHTFSTEIGPAILLGNGRVVAFGGTGRTAVYAPDHGGPGVWSHGPDFPVGTDGQLMTVRDAPAVLLPNGRVLCCAGLATGGSGWGGPPEFFEYDPEDDLLHSVATPPLNASVPYRGRMLMLPTGQVLYACGHSNLSIGTPARREPRREEELEPEITEVADELISGGQHKVRGRRFNGFSQACSYGDDCSCATNYPIARLRYEGGRVVYCRTFDHSTMAVATRHRVVHTTMEVPASAPSGRAHLEIVANGIASDPVEVRVK
jgi:hypothetical protein